MQLLTIKLIIIFFWKCVLVNTDLNNLPIHDNTTTRAFGITNLKISTTISTTGIYYCVWRYGGEFDVSSFYSGHGCYNYTGVNETITCNNNAGTMTSQLTLLHPQYKDLNINMQCSPSPSYSVKVVIKKCHTTREIILKPSNGKYGSGANISCPSGSELFYKVNGSFVVDRTTTCNAYAEWTNINNMLCSKGPSKTSITGNYSLTYGETANLICVYEGGWPAANFSKFYFDQRVTKVNKSSSWISPPLQPSDNNKVVECQAINYYTNHFKQSHKVNIALNVTYPPMTENHTIVCKCIHGSNDGCDITYSSNPPVNSAILTNETGEVISESSLCFETCQSELQSYKFCKLGISGNFTLKLMSTTFPDKELIINITATGVTKPPPPSTNMTIIIAIVAASSCFLIIIIIATVVFYVRRRRSIKDKKDVVNSSPGSRDIHTETGGVGENQSFANPAFENGAENSGLVTKSKKKQEYAVAQKGKKKKKTKDEKEIKDNPLYVAGSPDQVEDAYAEVNKKGKNIKEEKVNPLYATTQASGQTSGDYATVDLKKKKGKGIKKKEEKINPLYVSSDQPDKVEDAYAEVDKKKSKKAKAKTGKAGKKGNSQQASSSGGHEEVDLNKKKKKEKPTKEEKVNPLYVSSDQPDKVEDAYAEVDKKKNKKKSATKPDKEEKVNPLYVSSDQPNKVEDAYAEVDKKKNKKNPIKATPTKDQPSTSKNETYTEVKKLKKKPLNQNNNENTQQTQDDATYYSVVLHGSHEKDKDKLDESEDSEQE